MEEKTKDNPKGFEKVAAFIVDKRKAFYFIYAIIAVFCIISSGWVNVDNKLTDYLDEETETRRGLSIMEEEFTTYATAKIMVDNISYESAEKLSDKLADLNGVKSVAFDDTDKHYNESSALSLSRSRGTKTTKYHPKRFRMPKIILPDMIIMFRRSSEIQRRTESTTK